MKIRYRVHFKDNPQIRKNPSELDLQLWASQGIKVEKLGGYETLTTRDADPELLVNLTEAKVHQAIFPIRQQIQHQTVLINKHIKTSAEENEYILKLLDEVDTLSRGSGALAIIGAALSIIALVKIFCF